MKRNQRSIQREEKKTGEISVSFEFDEELEKVTVAEWLTGRWMEVTAFWRFGFYKEVICVLEIWVL
jgi:hypothetical protein